MTNSELPRVQPEEVASAVRQDKQDTVVVDVRDSQEFSAGHIKGALNLDSTAFTDNALVDKLVEQLQHKSQVVVHCAKSLQRGPASAALLKQRLLELGQDKEVVVLEGGFNKFSELYQTDSSVVEGGPADKPGHAAQANQHAATEQSH